MKNFLGKKNVVIFLSHSRALYAALCQLLQSRMGPRQALEGSWRPADASTFSSAHIYIKTGQQKRSVVLWQLFLHPPDTSKCFFYSSAQYVHSWLLLVSPSCLLGGPLSSGFSSQQAALQSWCLYCHGGPLRTLLQLLRMHIYMSGLCPPPLQLPALISGSRIHSQVTFCTLHWLLTGNLLNFTALLSVHHDFVSVCLCALFFPVPLRVPKMFFQIF